MTVRRLLASFLIVAGAWATPLVHAQVAPALRAGQATGTLTKNGKSVPMAFAAAWVPADDASRITLLLTDLAIPADVVAGKTTVLMWQMTSKTPFSGLELTFDSEREIVSAYVYEKDSRTGTSGLFAVKFERPAGKALIGSIKSTAAAAKMTSPIKLDARFSALLK